MDYDAIEERAFTRGLDEFLEARYGEGHPRTEEPNPDARREAEIYERRWPKKYPAKVK